MIFPGSVSFRASVFLVVVLVACTTSGTPRPTYVPKPADGRTFADPESKGCILNALDTHIEREVSDLRFTMSLDTWCCQEPEPRRLKLRVDALESSGPSGQVLKVDASHIFLEEGGKRIRPNWSGDPDRNGKIPKYDPLDMKNHFLATTLYFPGAPLPHSNAQVVFEPGAVKYRNRNIPISPVRFDIVMHAQVYSGSLSCGT